jgi:anion-transporting  ArsA/GET3 family ATPase
VGKTTVAAAVGLGLAQRGQRVLVLTIDPARRLAGALGVVAQTLDSRARAAMPETNTTTPPGRTDHATRVLPQRLRAAGVQVSGELWTMTLDVSATLDRLIAELSPDDDACERLLANPIYGQLAADGSGAQEIAAVAKLYELDREGAFDVIVLDTPPSRHALDFLDAPERLGGFLEGRAMSLLLMSSEGGQAEGDGDAPSVGGQASGRSPGRPSGLSRLPALLPRLAPRAAATRLLGGGTGALLSLFARATGLHVMGDLAAFLRLLGGVSGGLRQRAASVEALLRDPATGFLIVTSPEQEPSREAIFLHRSLLASQMTYLGLVVNRIHEGTAEVPDSHELAAELGQLLGAELGKRVATSVADLEVLIARDRASVQTLSEALGERSPVTVPELGEDVDRLAGLARVSQRVLG